MKKNQLKSAVSLLVFVAIIGGIISLTTNSTKVYTPIKETQTQWKNLKVLPQDISRDSLFFVMETFNASLGVKCSYCHASQKDDSTKLDFSSDEKRHKIIARGMLEMTNDINEKYFLPHMRDPKPKQVTRVHCITCHRGTTNPEAYLQNVGKIIPRLMPKKEKN